MEAGKLRRDGPFVRYWSAATVSLLGSQVTLLALPLTAIGMLHARASEVALLATASTLPDLLGLVVGERVGRLRRRPALVAADLGRAGLLVSIPIAYVAGALTLAQLYLVAAAAGCLSLVFELASQAYIPSLVDRVDLLGANAAFEGARAGAQTLGPALAGVLVRAFAAPLAIVADAASFVGSAALLATVGIPDPPVPSRPGATRETVRAVLTHPYLRALLAAHGLANLAIGFVWSVVMVFAVRTLGLDAALLGVALALGQVGAFAGVAVGRRLSERIGVGPALAVAFALFGPATLLIAVAPRAWALPLLAAGWIVDGLARALYGVFAASVRQAAIPPSAQAGVTGVTMTVGMGAFPLGTLLGWALVGPLGLRGAMVAGAVACFLPCISVVASPLVRLQRLDELDTPAFAGS